MIIKIGHLADAEQQAAAANAGVDMMVVPAVYHADDTPLPSPLPRVAVFTDAMVQEIITAVYHLALVAVQLNGDESSTYIDNLRRTIVPDIAPSLTIIKRCAVEQVSDIDRTKDDAGAADLWQFTLMPAFFATYDDKTAAWQSVAERYAGATPFLLSGFRDSDTLAAALSVQHPLFAGIHLPARLVAVATAGSTARLAAWIAQIRAAYCATPRR